MLSENTIKVEIDNSGRTSENSEVRMGGQLFDHSNTPMVNDGIDFTIRGYDNFII
jgi:hypothetical protein